MTSHRAARLAALELLTLLVFVGAGFASSIWWRRARTAPEARVGPSVGSGADGSGPGTIAPARHAAGRIARLTGATAPSEALVEPPRADAPLPPSSGGPTRVTAVRTPRHPPVGRTIHLSSDVTVTPKGIAVVQVPVPAAVAGAPRIDWEAQPTEDARLLSSAAGVLIAPTASLALVVRTPETARAGRLDVASVRFSNDTAAVQTVVSIEVARIRRPMLRLDRGTILVPNGDRLSLRGMVANQGNSVDTLELSARVPSMLDATVSPRRVVLAPGESRPVTIALRHRDPNAAGGGSLLVNATTAAGDTATSRAQVEVAPLARRQTRGPYLQLGAVTVQGDSLGKTPVLGASLFGTFRDNIQLFGQAVRPLDRSDVNTLGLARVGYSLNGAFLSANAPTWRGRVGVLSDRATTTTGENIFGVGASGGVRRGAWDGSAIVATSPSWVAGDGRMYSATAGYTGALGRGSLSASSLRDGFAGGRSLDAVGLGLEATPHPGLTVGAELAYRAFNGDQGIGAAATGEFHSPRVFGRAEVAHTPGGTSAFATSTDRAAVSGGLKLNRRLAVQASGFRATDQAPGRNPSTSRGVGAGIATNIAQETTVDLSLAARSFETEAVPAGFGNEEVTVKASLRTRFRGVLLGGYAGGGRSARTLIPLSGARASVGGARRVAGASAALQTAEGSFSTALDYESNAPGTGFLPRALSVGASANQVRIPGLRGGPRLDLGLQYYDWFETRPAGLQIQVGTEFVMNDGLRTRLMLERNPFLRAVGSTTPWVLSVRVDRGFRLPSGHRPGVRGLVYVDRNANGQHDAAEEPLAGVRVRRGNEFATTDRDGRFEFESPGTSGMGLDPLSLPDGQVAMPTPALGAHGERIQLPVVPTAPLRVRLRYQADSLGRIPTTRLDRITVTATDSAGVVWALQPDTSGTVIFDALPPGRYIVSADLNNLQERLRLIGAPPMVPIDPGAAGQDVLLTLAVRPIRVFNVVPGAGDAVGRRRR